MESPIGDSPPALIAAGTELVLRHGAHRRTMPLEAFFLAYGRQDRQRTQHPEVGRCHRIAQHLLARRGIARGPAQEAAVDQAVQVRRIGHAHRLAAQPFAAVDRE